LRSQVQQWSADMQAPRIHVDDPDDILYFWIDQPQDLAKSGMLEQTTYAFGVVS
jgi:hypothetical protein